MSRAARIARHTGILMGMELGLRVTDALVAVILARYLAPERFGLMAFALSYSNLFAILPGFGMGAMTTRDVAKEPDQISRYISNGLMAKALLAIATITLIWIVTSALRFSPEKQLVVMLGGLLMIGETNVRYVSSFFQGAQRMGAVAVTNLSVRVGWVIGSVAVMMLRGGVIQLLAVRMLITLAGLIASVGMVHFRLAKIEWGFEPKYIINMLKSSFPFALFRLFGQVYTDIDTVMLSTMRGDLITGWYAAGYKVLRIFGFIQNGFFGALLPALSKFSKQESKEELVKTMSRACRYMAILSMPIAGGMCVLADQLVVLIFGPDYAGAAPAMRILMWSLPLDFLNSMTVAAIAAINKEKKASAYLVAGCVFSGLSNLLVIPLWGHLGAAATTVGAEAFIFGLQLRLLRTSLPDLRAFHELIKPLGATLVMMGVTWLLRPAGLVAAVAGGGIVYIGALFAAGLIGPDEWSIARKVFAPKPAQGQA